MKGFLFFGSLIERLTCLRNANPIEFIISTEGRNHTQDSTMHVVNLCGITSAISPFGRNDKIV